LDANKTAMMPNIAGPSTTEGTPATAEKQQQRQQQQKGQQQERKH
jgi:hypothetical protein